MQEYCLIASDGEHVLRVRKSVACRQNNDDKQNLAIESLRLDSDFVPEIIFEEQCAQHPDILQLQHLLSQEWVRG